MACSYEGGRCVSGRLLLGGGGVVTALTKLKDPLQLFYGLSTLNHLSAESPTLDPLKEGGGG